MIVRENDKEKDSKKYRGREKWWETWQWANVGDLKPHSSSPLGQLTAISSVR